MKITIIEKYTVCNIITNANYINKYYNIFYVLNFVFFLLFFCSYATTWGWPSMSFFHLSQYHTSSLH